MAHKEREAVEIDCYCYSSPILRAKNRDQVKELEKKKDCFILEFDPYDVEIIDIMNLPSSGATDLCVVGEKGQIACRDYPHARHTCAKYPFKKTPHKSQCELCYCYVCDSGAPCEKWVGSSGHCHAFNSEYWEEKRKARKKLKALACRETTPLRLNCAYVCDSDAAAPCRKRVGSSGPRHGFNGELRKTKRQVKKYWL